MTFNGRQASFTFDAQLKKVKFTALDFPFSGQASGTIKFQLAGECTSQDELALGVYAPFTMPSKDICPINSF